MGLSPISEHQPTEDMSAPNTTTAEQPKAVAVSKKREVRTLIESPEFKSQVARALPRHLTPDRFLRVAITATMRTPALLDCTPESLTKCLLDCSAYGIEPDGRRAHLIPFKDRKNNVTLCTLIIDYKGLVELAMRSGLVSHIHADVVREGDLFEYNLGEIKTHVPWFLRRDGEKPPEPGQDVAVYAMAKMKDGATAVAVMSIEEVISIRDNSQGWQAFKKGFTSKCPWDPADWVSEQEMKKKTAMRRLCKVLPLSPEFRDAVESDDEAPPIKDAVVVDPPRPIFTRSEAIPAATTEQAPAGDAAPIAPTTQTPQAELESAVTTAGRTFDDLLTVVTTLKFDSGNATTFAELPTPTAKRLVKSFKDVLEAMGGAK
jgi:recombination protein RecT